MKSLRLFVSCGALLLCLALAAYAGPEASPSSLRTEVDVQSESPGVFLLSARVTDLASGDVVAAPSLRVPATEEANTESTLPGGSITFTGKVDPALHKATYTVRVLRGDKVISEHSASVAVQ